MKSLKALVFVCALMTASWSFAAATSKEADWEVRGGTSASFNFTSFSPVTWNYTVSGNVGRKVFAGMQVVLGPTLFHLYSGSAWNFGLSLDAGVRLNSSFSDDIKNDFFLFIGTQIQNLPGITTTVAGVTTNSTVTAQLAFELGKRFAITDNVTYAPSVNFRVINTTALSITPLQFSLLF